jgi:hypothetical protein
VLAVDGTALDRVKDEPFNGIGNNPILIDLFLKIERNTGTS